MEKSVFDLEKEIKECKQRIESKPAQISRKTWGIVLICLGVLMFCGSIFLLNGASFLGSKYSDYTVSMMVTWGIILMFLCWMPIAGGIVMVVISSINISKINRSSAVLSTLEQQLYDLNGGSYIIENKPDDNYEKLKKLKELYDEGILTKEEFEAKKKELL